MSDWITTEPRTGYEGPAELWVKRVKQFDADVHLTGYVDVTEPTTDGANERIDGATSWSGFFEGPAKSELPILLGHTIEVRLPNGRVGEAVLPNTRTFFLQGHGEAPF